MATALLAGMSVSTEPDGLFSLISSTLQKIVPVYDLWICDCKWLCVCVLAGFDELSCECGVEVLYPPIPCGALPPECRQPCTRAHTCDHKGATFMSGFTMPLSWIELNILAFSANLLLLCLF